MKTFHTPAQVYLYQMNVPKEGIMPRTNIIHTSTKDKVPNQVTLVKVAQIPHKGSRRTNIFHVGKDILFSLVLTHSPS